MIHIFLSIYFLAPEIATHPDIAARIAALSDGVPEQRPTCPEGAPGSLELPQYYNDGTMFQTGPSTHNVWGFAAGNASCPVEVREKCRNGYGNSLVFFYYSRDLYLQRLYFLPPWATLYDSRPCSTVYMLLLPLSVQFRWANRYNFSRCNPDVIRAFRVIVWLVKVFFFPLTKCIFDFSCLQLHFQVRVVGVWASLHLGGRDAAREWERPAVQPHHFNRAPREIPADHLWRHLAVPGAVQHGHVNGPAQELGGRSERG